MARRPRTGDPDAPTAWCSAWLADPELPAELAELLAERLDDQVSWQIRVLRQRFDLADEDRLLAAAYGYRQQERRDPG